MITHNLSLLVVVEVDPRYLGENYPNDGFYRSPKDGTLIRQNLESREPRPTLE